MSKPWSELNESERQKERDRARDRIAKCREEGRYGADWRRNHEEAQRILEDSDKDRSCYACGSQENVRAHHVDGDHYNNGIENLEWCCHSCDSKLAYQRRINK